LISGECMKITIGQDRILAGLIFLKQLSSL
jgi:hypothetical protein